MPPDLVLTDLQLAIMRVVWDRGRATVSEITDALRPDRGLAQTTVATILSRLEKRGVVGHDVSARQFIYFPKVSEPEARRSMVSDITERLFGGDPAALVSHLLTAKQFSRGDISKLKAMIAEYEKSGPKDGKRR